MARMSAKGLALIRESLDKELLPLCFLRERSTWNRQQGALVEVIDLQKSAHSGTVTVNAGNLSREIHQICWGYDAETFVEEPACTVRARIGELMDDEFDLWWDINARNAADEIVASVRSRVLPFLERIRSLEGMREWLISRGVPSRRKTPPEAIIFAIIESQLGHKSTACSVLTEIERKALGAWKQGVREVAERIGCADKL